MGVPPGRKVNHPMQEWCNICCTCFASPRAIPEESVNSPKKAFIGEPQYCLTGVRHATVTWML